MDSPTDQRHPGVPGCATNGATGYVDVQLYFGHSEFNLAGLQAGKATLTFSLVNQIGFEDGMALLPKSTTFSLGAYPGSTPGPASSGSNFNGNTAINEFGRCSQPSRWQQCGGPLFTERRRRLQLRRTAQYNAALANS